MKTHSNHRTMPFSNLHGIVLSFLALQPPFSVHQLLRNLLPSGFFRPFIELQLWTPSKKTSKDPILSQDKGIGHWRFSCILSFPWRPILSATGYTEYYFDAQSGKVCRHVEHWNVPKKALFKQILRPSRGFGLKDYVNKWLKMVQMKL